MRFRRQISVLVAAVVATGSLWFYVDHILVPHQIAEAAAHGRPRGNLSDLYPRWLGARELLLHGRNPYSDDITREIQQGYYGRVLDPAMPNDPKDQQRFAYPAYVVFLLAPLVRLPFRMAQEVFFGFELSLTALSAWLWLALLRWRLTMVEIATLLLLTLGSFPAVQGLKLQQMSLLVAGLIAAAATCIARGSLFWGGALLALTTIKPQLALPSVAWLLGWTMADWKERKPLLGGFALTLALLMGAAEMVLPGWIGMFAVAVKEYRRYTGNKSIIEVLTASAVGAENVASSAISTALMILAIAMTGILLWKLKKKSYDRESFAGAIALALALTVVIVPMYAPYNQVLLLPSILLLVKRRQMFLSGPWLHRALYWVGGALLMWQWAASATVALVYCGGRHVEALELWRWPLFSTFLLPVWIFGLTLLCARREWADQNGA